MYKYHFVDVKCSSMHLSFGGYLYMRYNNNKLTSAIIWKVKFLQYYVHL